MLWMNLAESTVLTLRELPLPNLPAGLRRSNVVPYNLIDIAIVDRHPHRSLSNRTIGKVRAVLHEEQDERQQDHALSVTVWTDTTPEMNQDDIDMALMLKAADIVGRVKANLELSDLRQPAG